MTYIRRIVTPHFSFSAKYISEVILKQSTNKRFLCPSIRTVELIIIYYDEINILKELKFSVSARKKSIYMKNIECVKRIKKYIEMDIGSSSFIMEHQQNQQFIKVY